MPFIDSKVSVRVPREKEESIKSQLGEAISLVGKTESWLMVGFEDEYDLYFKGRKEERAAFVDVSIYGHADGGAFDRLTARICDIFEKELGIPKDKIYVKYSEVENWGWNGSNF